MMIFACCSWTERTERCGCEPRAIRYVCQQRWPKGEPLHTPRVEAERKRERQTERDGEKQVWPAKWLSRSPSLLSDKSNASWQSALWLQIHWLPWLHRWSLSHTHTRTHAHPRTPARSLPRTCTHITQCNLNGWLLSALNRLISVGKTIVFEFDKQSWSHIVNQHSTGKQQHCIFSIWFIKILQV